MENQEEIIGKMGGTFSKQSLRLELISIYEDYIKNFPEINNILKEKAKKNYISFIGAGIIFGEPFEEAINGLEPIGWEFPDLDSNKICKLSLKEAKRILNELKKA